MRPWVLAYISRNDCCIEGHGKGNWVLLLCERMSNHQRNDLVMKCTGRYYNNFNINFDYHFVGYAKVQPELIDFIKQFKQDTGVLFEPVYTGKCYMV